MIEWMKRLLDDWLDGWMVGLIEWMDWWSVEWTTDLWLCPSLHEGTNDKPGGPHYVLRWTSPRVVKQTHVPLTEWKYPYMGWGMPVHKSVLHLSLGLSILLSLRPSSPVDSASNRLKQTSDVLLAFVSVCPSVHCSWTEQEDVPRLDSMFHYDVLNQSVQRALVWLKPESYMCSSH